MALQTSALANAIDDGNAGLDALNAGDYAKAVTLFTHALKSGELQGDDKEFAYLNRGRAYLGEGQNKLALADLHEALKLKPDDPDAQTALQQAEGAIHGGSANAAPAQSAGWGMLADMAGHYYWIDQAGMSGHIQAVRYEWIVPNQSLSYIIRSKSSELSSGVYKLDASGRTIMEAQAVQNGTVYGTAFVEGNQETEQFFVNNQPVRAVSVLQPGGIVSMTFDRYENGSWVTAISQTYSPATEDEIEQAGFFKKPKTGDKTND